MASVFKITWSALGMSLINSCRFSIRINILSKSGDAHDSSHGVFLTHRLRFEVHIYILRIPAALPPHQFAVAFKTNDVSVNGLRQYVIFSWTKRHVTRHIRSCQYCRRSELQTSWCLHPNSFDNNGYSFWSSNRWRRSSNIFFLFTAFYWHD